jgi:hypothetical protein
MRNVYKFTIEKPEGKRSLGKPRPKCEGSKVDRK